MNNSTLLTITLPLAMFLELGTAHGQNDGIRSTETAGLLLSEQMRVSPTAFEMRRLLLSADFGIYGPYGIFGLEAAGAVHPNVVLAIGGGLTVAGYRVAVNSRFRLITSHHHSLSVEAGLSFGPLQTVELGCFSPRCDEPDVKPWRWSFTVQARPGVTYERIGSSGFYLRAYIGLAALLYHSDDQCEGRCGDPDRLRFLPYLGVGVGHAFRVGRSSTE